ncbi:MAG: hypothetical protein JW894_07605 [Bacteroidales bacterium]|nr:hypothetical protein [Bacteroidales bacterium]
MKIFKYLVVSVGILMIVSGFSYKRLDYRDGMYKNVCKDLKNNVLVYFIFVDSKSTSPWTEFDIQSTIDSMEAAINWIEDQARVNNVQLNIISDYYIGEEYTTVRKNLPYETVINSVTTPNFNKGLEELNKWADNIAKKVGTDVHIVEKDGIPEIKNPRNKERLVAHLRDEKQVESVALLYMVNNYYREDISIPVNHLNTDDVEFAIVSYKYPAVIAQNILNLFGAADLSKTLYRRNEQKIKLAMEFFPNDIMQDVYAKSLSKLEIGEYSKYLIGWKERLDPKYQPLLTDKIINF